MGYLYIVLAAVLWGLLGPASRVTFREGVEPLEVAFWRAALAALLFGVHARARRETRVAARDLPAVLTFGVVGVGLLYGAYFLAVEEGGAALAAVLLYTAPLWVAILATLFLGERMGSFEVAALALAITGVAGIALSSGGSVLVTPVALFWGLLSGWAYALYYIFGKKYFQRYSAPTLFLYALPTGALALLPFVSFSHKSTLAWATLIFLAAVPTYGAYLLYAASLRRIDATRASTVATVEPVVAAVVAYFVWGERLSPTGYLFSALVLAGVILIVLRSAPWVDSSS
ncbi:MAG: DMT family transporter [Gemmatimonadota bacterium]|nr:DMT family transporter [Gemmatimonadota bacterium]